MPSPKRLIALALMASTLALPAAALAGVVVSASGPSAGNFPAGKRIGNSERIVLRAGDTLTVLDGKGTRVLRGAGTYSLDQQSGPSRRNTFVVLTQQRAAAQVRTGATRSGDTTGLSPTNIWYVDISRPGRNCLASADQVRLWRGSAEGEGSYTLRTASGSGQTVEFEDGSVLARWDIAALPVTEGTDYTVSGDSRGTLSFVVLDNIGVEADELAAQFIENGCTRQLEILTSAMMVPEA